MWPCGMHADSQSLTSLPPETARNVLVINPGGAGNDCGLIHAAENRHRLATDSSRFVRTPGRTVLSLDRIIGTM